MIRYRSDLQRNLTALEADGNIRHLVDLAASIQAKLPAGLDVEGAQLVLALADGSELTVDLPPAGIQHAPANGKTHGSKDGDWTVIDAVPEAAKDGVVRGRKDGQWVAISAGGGGGDDGGGSGGTSGSRLSVPAWDTDAEYLPGDLVRHRGAVWMARVETFASYPAPITTSEIWQLFSFPDVDCDLTLSHRILHYDEAAPEYSARTMSEVVLALEARMRSAEQRISALE